jgi:hypothetical protein
MKPPSTLALRLLEAIVPPDQRQEIVGDLIEEWHRSEYRRAARTALLWLHAIALCFRFLFAFSWLRGSGGDVRIAMRSMLRAPGFSLVVVTIMATGIGLNSAIFSIIYGILIRPFPYHEPERLVRIETLNQRNGNRAQNSLPDLEDWRSRNRTL